MKIQPTHSLSDIHPIPTTWLLSCVFLLAFFFRVYWLHEKENLYGDEPTSVCIAYNLPGWGEKTYPSHIVFTGKQLREQAYIDDQGGIKGLLHDLNILHQDNRDPSHASLYYMALRCALSGMDTPDMNSLIQRSGALNLLFFSLSFLTLYFLLKNLFPQEEKLILFCLLLAYLNPVSISNTLLTREYQLSEWLFTLWGFWCWKMHQRIEKARPLWTFGTFCSGILISAALLSCGYFNALFICLTGLTLLLCSFRQHTYKDIVFYICLSIGCILLCVILYKGFFNFLNDTRTMEVTEKMQGHSWSDNVLSTAVKGGYIALIRVLTPIWSGILVAMIINQIFQHKKMTIPHIPSCWLFVCALLWVIVVMWMAPWKSSRFIASALPLCMIFTAYSISLYLRKSPKTWNIFLIAAFIGYACLEYPIEHLERTANCPWPSHTRRVILYGPNHSEKNTLSLMIPYLKDEQECVIVERPEHLFRYAVKEDSILYVYGEKNSPILRKQPGFITETRFNSWMGCFTFTVR